MGDPPVVAGGDHVIVTVDPLLFTTSGFPGALGVSV